MIAVVIVAALAVAVIAIVGWVGIEGDNTGRTLSVATNCRLETDNYHCTHTCECDIRRHTLVQPEHSADACNDAR